VNFRREGLAVILHSTPLLDKVVKIRVTLLLRWFEVVVIFLIVAGAALAVNLRAPIAHTALISQWAPQHLLASAATVATLVLVVGCLLALWKSRQLFVYGVWEVVFGVFSAFQTALFLWPHGDLSKLVALGSSLYVISRGVGNIGDAFAKETEIERLKLEMTLGQDIGPVWPFSAD
jgi:hypothetical protein